MAIEPKTVRRIADLARIRVPEDQLGTMASELDGIMRWIEQLNEVDTEGVAAMTGVADFPLPMRPDEVTDGGAADKVLSNAPEREGAFFAVPKVVE